MHLWPRMNVMLDFIWTLPVQLRGARNKWTLQKLWSKVGFEPLRRHGLQITSRPSVPLSQFSNVTSEGIKLDAIRVSMNIYTIYKIYLSTVNGA